MSNRDVSGRVGGYGKWIAMGFVCALLIVAAIRIAFPPFYMNSEAMVPTFHVDDRFVVNRLSYLLSSPKHGDIIAFRWSESQILKGPFPPTMKSSAVNAFRILGLPGDTIEIEDGEILRNGQRLEESYTSGPTMPQGLRLFVPDKHVFVLGDNRTDAVDSRYLGPVAQRNIIGKVWLAARR